MSCRARLSAWLIPYRRTDCPVQAPPHHRAASPLHFSRPGPFVRAGRRPWVSIRGGVSHAPGYQEVPGCLSTAECGYTAVGTWVRNRAPPASSSCWSQWCPVTWHLGEVSILRGGVGRRMGKGLWGGLGASFHLPLVRPGGCWLD